MKIMIAALLVCLLGAVSASTAQEPAVEKLVPEVVAVYPHDPTAYTQGLLLQDGFLYESTGKYGGFSSMRKVDPATGEVLYSISLPEDVFAEGLALVDDRFIQITWYNGYALTYDYATFAEGAISDVGVIVYQSVGWGLCYDGDAVYMTDGSETLYKRDPETFEVLETLAITLDGQPLRQANELECVGDSIFANIYQTDTIVRIDKATGSVTASIDAAGLLTDDEQASLGTSGDHINFLQFNRDTTSFSVRSEFLTGGEVLNGIAYNPETDTFLITGKLWPKLFEVRFVPQE